MQKEFKILKKYFSFIGIEKRKTFIYFAIAISGMIAGLITPIIYGHIIDYIISNQFEKVIMYLVIYLVFYIVYSLIRFAEYNYYANYYEMVFRKIQNKIKKKLYSLDMKYFSNVDRGKLVNTTTKEADDVIEFFDWAFMELVNVISMLFMLTIIFSINFYIGIFVIGVNFINFYAIKIFNNKQEVIKKEIKKTEDKKVNFIEEYVNGIKEVRIFNIVEKLNLKFENINNRFVGNAVKSVRLHGVKDTLLPIVGTLVQIIILSISAYMIYKGELTAAWLIVLMSYYNRLEFSVRRVMNLLSRVREIGVSLDRLIETIEIDEDGFENEGTLKLDNIKGKIKFENVSFKYEDTLVLNNLSFEINPNKVTALRGISGSGKSTVFNLLMRFYKPTEGSIKIDGNDIYEFEKETYSHNLSVVTQSTFLFNMSIIDNFKLVNDNEEEIVEACKRVGIHDYIMSLSDGYDTNFGNNASFVSGGQKQRLSIARMLLKKAEILLFDEITSSLDIEASNQINNLIHDLKKDHTILIISHKEEEINMADEIIELEVNE